MRKKETALTIGAIRPIRRTHILIAFLLKLLIPLCSIIVELIYKKGPADPALIGKWFLFWGLGAYLLASGVTHIVRPIVDLNRLYGSKDQAARGMVRKLGIAKISMGVVGIFSIFDGEVREIAAVMAVVYFGMTTLWYFLRKADPVYEVLTLVSDLMLFSTSLLFLFSTVFSPAGWPTNKVRSPGNDSFPPYRLPALPVKIYQ